MDAPRSDAVRATVEAVYRAESRRVLATLIRLLGDFDLAEEALHDAFAAAVEQWPREGVPANPRAWLVSTGRFKAIDAHAPARALRRRARRRSPIELSSRGRADADVDDGAALDDDRLRLIFTCCHPALSPDAQIALTLREVCGLTTEEIARAFLGAAADASPSGSCAPRPRSATRAFPTRCRRAASCRERLDSVLHVDLSACSTRATRRRPASR